MMAEISQLNEVKFDRNGVKQTIDTFDLKTPKKYQHDLGTLIK